MMTAEPFLRAEAEPVRPAPPPARRGLVRTLFGDIVSAALSAACALLILLAVPRLANWAIIHGVWSGVGTSCRGEGACWAFLAEKAPFILFGIYPADERWRPIIVVILFLLVTLWTLPVRNWTRPTLWLWGVSILVSLVLMGGGMVGLGEVPTTDWGGLPITLLLTILSLAIGFPFAVALALGRQSSLPLVRHASIAFIEVVRGLPLLSMLFIAAILLPIMLPDGMTIDNLLRALVALTLSSAANLAEVLRGGLQGVSRGQEEAARALGLGWFQTARLIVVPQAIRNVIPPLTNMAVVVVKNTSLVLVVGLFDLLSAGRAALADPAWPDPYVETYLFIASIYFVICFGISRYAAWLERRMLQGARR